MSVQDEHELRERLTGLLGDVTPKPAPVGRAMRQGKGIRMRRWAGAVTAIAVVAVAAALAPAVVRSLSSTPAAPAHHKVPHYRVTVRPVGTDASHGVIAKGVTDGRGWKVIMHGSAASYSVIALGPFGLSGGLASEVVGLGGAPFSAGVLGGSDSGTLIYGDVAKDVTRLVVGLTNGEQLTLRPVTWSGHRWLGLVLPQQAGMTRAIAYSGSRELSYSVPFDGTFLNRWWRPGQPVPGRVVQKVGAGVVDRIRWQVTAEIGPWGYCYVYGGGNVACMPSQSDPQRVSAAKPLFVLDSNPLGPGGGFTPYCAVATVEQDVRRVELTYSDGSSASFATVAVGGDRLVAFSVPKDATVVSSVEYGAAGQVVGRPRAAIWNGPLEQS